MGKILLFFGLAMIVVGLFFILGGKISWLGKLPGDINIQGRNFSFYFPLGTCILISIILSFIFWLFSRR